MGAVVQSLVRRGWLLGATLALVAVWLAPAAHAEKRDLCVKCTNPDETYRCRVKGVDPKFRDALKLYCVYMTAKDGGHSKCKARKATSACNGPVKVYSYDGPPLPDSIAKVAPRAEAAKKRIRKDQADFDQSSGGDQPKSLVDLGGRAVDASRTGLRSATSALGLTSSESEAPAAPVAAPAQDEEPGLVRQAAQNTGSAVGGFARRSYRCMVSFFSECRSGQ